jgi:hypothetical protein
MLSLLLAAALAGTCPDVTPVQATTAFDGSRLVTHDKTFLALDAPAVMPLAQGGYDLGLQGMAVTQGDVRRLYPVDGIAWHHVVNDEVGGVPIAVTY